MEVSLNAMTCFKVAVNEAIQSFDNRDKENLEENNDFRHILATALVAQLENIRRYHADLHCSPEATQSEDLEFIHEVIRALDVDQKFYDKVLRALHHAQMQQDWQREQDKWASQEPRAGQNLPDSN